MSESNTGQVKSVEQVTPEQEQALQYCALLIAGCVTARLTGTREADELYRVHVKDCLESLPYLPKPSENHAIRVIDVGSGGGLPGLVWAICRPDLQVTLLDSIGKKCRAVEEISCELGLQNVRVIHDRAEKFARLESERESFDLACARAVANAGITVELLAPFVRAGGTLMTFKGPKLRDELDEVKGQWRKLGLKEPLILPYGIPGESNRCLVFWERVGHCPRVYPRSVGMAEKKGWWL